MQRQKATVFLVGFALILSANAAKKSEPPTECAQLGEICHLRRHCCENFKCDQSDTLGRFECQEKARLGATCKYTSDCNDIFHSVCTSKTCTCRDSTVEVNAYACKPLLNAFCWSNETCAPKNTICINNECQCKDGFIAEKNECLPVVLGLPCSDDAECRSVKFGKCSTRKFCTCSNNTIATNGRKCSVALGETCESDQDCGVTDSWCDNNKCRCSAQYIAYSNIECRTPYLGMPCKNSADCSAYIFDSICIENTCTCKANHTLVDENACLPTTISYCKEHEECQEVNGDCIAGYCQCRDGYLLRKSKCFPAQLTGRCRANSDCSEVKFAVCSKQQCTCADGFYTVNATTCAKALGGSCAVNEDCTVKFSNCSDNKCGCNQGYMQYSESQCSARELGSTCSDDNTCNLIKYAHCFESQCSCMNNYVEFDVFQCTGLLNATCSDHSECDHENSVCIDHKCQCDSSYHPQSNKCVLMFLEQRCSIDKDCIDISYSKCSNAEKCICHRNYLRTGPKTCSPTLGGYCTSKEDCVTVKAKCSKNQCRCSAGYMQRSDNLCIRVFIGQTCSFDRDCDNIANAECFEKKCKCRPGYTKFDSRVCLPLIGENCREHKECAVYNSNCVDNKCQCLETFVPQSQSKCVPTGIDGLCYTDDDCIITNTNCSRFQYCVCKQNYISSDRMCVSTLGAYCAESATCVTNNSECIDNECQCSQDFVRGPYNDCLPIQLGFACRTDLNCNTIQNAKCIDNICVCKPDTFALTSSTCTNLLNIDCSSSDECGIDDSYCFDNKCQCRPDSVAVSDMMCEKRSALYQCDKLLDCGEPWRSNCFQNRCVCNSNHIAVSALTCLPILGGNCWRDDQCTTVHSQCIGLRCKCKPNFIAVAVNMCVTYSVALI